MSLLVLRANYICAAVVQMLDAVQDCGIKVVIAADFSRGHFDTGRFDVVEMTCERLLSCGLFTGIAEPMWQCGDYALYAALEHAPAEEMFWLVESDVRFNMADLAAFFRRIESCGVDCALARYAEASERWAWYAGAAKFGFKVYRCQFPIVFAKRAAISYAYDLRRKQSAEMPVGHLRDRSLWPNDEAFLASALNFGGFRVQDFNDFGLMQTGATFRYEPPILQEEFDRLPIDELVYHPVLDRKLYRAKLLRHVKPDQQEGRLAAERERLSGLGFTDVDIVDILALPHS